MKTGDKRIRSTICHGCLQAGPSVRRAYTMVYFKVSQNFNGTLAIRRIVMVYFKSRRIVMAAFKLTLVLMDQVVQWVGVVEASGGDGNGGEN